MTGKLNGVAWLAVVGAMLVTMSGCQNLFNADDSDSDPATYTVTYDANGSDSGTAPDDQTKIEGEDLTLASNSGGLGRSGYTFAGWNTADDGSGTAYAEGATYSEDADLTLYARWTQLPTYTVTYDANGADSGTAPNDQTKIEGEDLTLSGNSGNLARSGYTFAGWNTANDGSGTAYAEGAAYSEDADLTLHAKWMANTYTISYNTNGADGGAAPDDQEKTHAVELTLAANSGNLARTGYTFVGWNTASDGSGTAYAEGATYTMDADLTLYAEWQWATELSVGDTGPAGGVVFYDKGAYSEGWRYLEAWTADESGTYQWKTSNTETTATSTDVGSGYENTYSAMTGTEHPAAEVMRNAGHGGYTDWFLPSQDGLNEMNGQQTNIGGFGSSNYWSSSEKSSNFEFAWGQPFPTGVQFAANKVSELKVRAARRF